MISAPFSYGVLARDVPSQGRDYELRADAEQCTEVADSLGTAEVRSLAGSVTVKPARHHSYRVRGTVKAEVVQTCVVTLEPVVQSVSEPIDLMLTPAEDETLRHPEAEVLVDPLASDTPEVFHNGRIDLGIILTEHLALGLDPYPRAAGVDFSGHAEDPETKRDSPFAVLAEKQKRDS